MKFGDISQLEKHHIVCGSLFDGTNYRTLVGNKRADSVFSDPQYSIRVDGPSIARYGLDIAPLCVDTAILRWQRHTGCHAIHVESHKRFDEIMQQLQGDEHE